MRTVLDAQEERIKAIVGGDEVAVSDKTLRIFCEHLRTHLKSPNYRLLDDYSVWFVNSR